MKNKLKDRIKYYFWATYRRKLLDKLLEENRHYYKGRVLDIGGRERGKFEKPKNKVKKWIFVDVEKKHDPDIVLDVANMHQIKTRSIDVVNAIELFEHVENIEEGLKECYRVLKKNGMMLLSAPFLFPIHADPYDFQRWTSEKWKRTLKKLNFKVEKLISMGSFFTVMMDMKKTLISQLPYGIRHLCRLVYPLMDLIVKMDNLKIVTKNERLNKYTTGYFMMLTKGKNS